MTRTTLEDYQRQLTETGAYRTEESHRARARRSPGGWLTARFAFSISRVFPLCALYDMFGRLTVRNWERFCMSAVTMPEACGMALDVSGFGPRMAHGGPVVYVCNHLSTLETILMPPTLIAFGPLRIVAKAAIAHLPLLERSARNMGIVPLGRKDPKADLLALYEAGRRHIAEGASFLIFPQGTRQDVFSRGRYSSIGAKLAEKTGVPIVPLAVDTRCLPTRKSGLFKGLFKDFGTLDTSCDIRIAAGPVIPCGKAREMHDASFDWIADRLEAWGLPTEREAKSHLNP